MSSAKNIKLTSLDDLFSTGAQRQDDLREKVMDIPLSQLYPFKYHPFQVNDNEELRELAKSISENGMVSPAIARPRKEGGYELIAGHRRKAACEIAGIETMPVLVREMDDDAATIIMVDSNKQRENLLPSEKAWSYKMKLDAMKRQAGRPSKENCGQVDHNYRGLKSREIIADESTDSAKQIQRYIRLTNLIPELLKMVDARRIAFNPAVELSYLPKEKQNILLEAMQEHDCTPSLSQAVRMKALQNEGKLEADVIFKMLLEPKANQREKINFRHEQLKQYFPKNYTPKQIEDSIIRMLEERQKKMQKQREHELER